ncbi:MAG: hypothetical protein KGL59_07065 [Acidobacteriota bacterium]|nr:hypothetical protein [Acidobacteriota bacterium]
MKKSSSPLPPDARQHPESISISRTGIVLYAKQEPNSGGRPLHWYLWKNGQTYDLLAASREERPAKGNSTLVTSATPVALLGTDARHLFWFENRLSVIQRENEGEISQSGEFRSWTSDLNARNTRQVVSVALPSCKCETAVCEETCPIIDAWAPDRGVSDFFFLTRWIQGQTSSDFLETILYRAAGAVWVPQKLPKPIYEFLDAANGGNTYIAAVPDGGCCGWENESDDITDLARGGGGEQITFFDEFARFHNRDYDVSFFTPKALFSPDASQIAYSITSTYRPGEQIRLADQGRENPRELKQIQNALTDLPRLEVVQIPKLQIRDDVARTGIVQPTNLRPAFSLPNVELIGWLDSRRVLAWQHGELFVINASTGQSAPTGLKAEAASRVFIR